jgi:phage terminase large subunit-like protein
MANPLKGQKVKLERLRNDCLGSLEILAEQILIPAEFGIGFKLCDWHRARLRELSDAVTNNVLRRLDLWFRKGFKSTFISRYTNIFRYLRNPNLTILFRHGDANKAEGIVMGCKSHHLHNMLFRTVFPEYCPERGEKYFGTRSEFNLPNSKNFSPEPTMRGVGIEANLTGDHYMHICDDDIEKRDNVTTQDTRAKLIQNWSDTPSLKTSDLVYEATHHMCGTTWHADGLYLGHIIPKFGPDSDASPTSKWIVSWYPAQHPDGRLEAPEILDEGKLAALLEDEGPYRYSSNYLLSPTNPETATFKNEWVRYEPYPKVFEHYDKWWRKDCMVRRVLTVDLAESTKTGADMLAYLIIDIDDMGRWYFREAFKARMDTLAFIRKILGLHETWEFDAIYVDAMATQKYFSKWALREAKLQEKSIPLIPVEKSSGQQSKGLRILACGPRWARGDCYIVERMAGSQVLINDMINYPNIGHDDLLDAMAQLEMMEGRGNKKASKTPPPGTYGHMRDLLRPKQPQMVGNWWANKEKRKNIPMVRRKYGS